MTSWSSTDVPGTSSERTLWGRKTNLLQRGELPAWESFPLADRHLLIGVIVQTARRQVQSQAMARRWRERR